MLKEFRRLRQEPDGFRRLFSDDYFDLWLWFDQPDGRLLGFQLVILDPVGDDKVFTWNHDTGAMYTGVLPDKDAVGYKKTRFLASDGPMDRMKIVTEFLIRSTNLPPEFRRVVERELMAWPDVASPGAGA